jgi:hypothetical protein
MTTYVQTLKINGPKGTPCAPKAGSTGFDALPQTTWNCQFEPSFVSGLGENAYIAGIENYTLSFSHQMTAVKLPITRTGMNMKGQVLRCKSGTKCGYGDFESMKDIIPDNENRGDVSLTIGEVLEAVVPHSHVGVPKGTLGMNLDELSGACPGKCKDPHTGKESPLSNRWLGTVILVELQYDNTGLIIKDSSTDDVRFNVRFWPVSGSIFHIEVPFLQKGTTRTIHELSGLRFVTLVKGKLGLFSLTTLFTQLTTSIAMVLVSTTIVDAIITHLMTNRQYYQHIKYQDDDECLQDLVDYLENADIPKEEKERRLANALALKESTGVDWKKICTLGTDTAAPDVPHDLFATKVSENQKFDDVENKAAQERTGTENTPLIAPGATQAEPAVPPASAGGSCGCVIA